MKFGKALTASTAVFSMLLASGVASAAPALSHPSSATRLSLAGSPTVQFARASSLQRKGASHEMDRNLSTPLIIVLVLAGAVGLAAAGGAFRSDRPHSP